MPRLRWIAIVLLTAAPNLSSAQEEVAESDVPARILVEQLLSDDETVAQRAAEALLRRCEFDFDWWDGNPMEIAAHERVVEELRPHVQQLISALDDQDAAVRDSALYCVMLLGPAAQEAAPHIWDLARRGDLRESDDDASSGELFSALAALRSILPDDVPATEFVVRLLRELPEEQKRRLRELRVVREALGQDGNSQLDVDGVVNYTVSGSYLAACSVPLLRLGWGAAEVPGLLELTTSEFALVVRLHAVLALTVMGEEAMSAVPALMQLLDADEVLLRYSAANALVVIQLDEAPLNEILSRARLPNEDQVELCEWHCELCSEEQRERDSFKGLDADAIQYYINALKYGRGSVRREVLRQIKLAGPNAAAVLPEIDAALSDPNEMTRRLAEEAIAAIQPTRGPDGDQRPSNRAASIT